MTEKSVAALLMCHINFCYFFTLLLV